MIAPAVRLYERLYDLAMDVFFRFAHLSSRILYVENFELVYARSRSNHTIKEALPAVHG